MYVEFLKDHKGHKKGSVSYQTRAADLIKEGVAKEIDYDKWHKENGGKPGITLKDETGKKEGEKLTT